METAVSKIGDKIDTLTATIAGVDKAVAVLSAKLDDRATRADVEGIKGELKRMPTKWFVGTTVFAILFTAFAALSAVIIYLEKLRALLGAH